MFFNMFHMGNVGSLGTVRFPLRFFVLLVEKKNVENIFIWVCVGNDFQLTSVQFIDIAYRFHFLNANAFTYLYSLNNFISARSILVHLTLRTNDFRRMSLSFSFFFVHFFRWGKKILDLRNVHAHSSFLSLSLRRSEKKEFCWIFWSGCILFSSCKLKCKNENACWKRCTTKQITKMLIKFLYICIYVGAIIFSE